MDEPLIVALAPKIPYVLRNLSRERGVPARELVAKTIETYGTLGEAADDLGISNETLRFWRKRLNIQIRSVVVA